MKHIYRLTYIRSDLEALLQANSEGFLFPISSGQNLHKNLLAPVL